MEIIYSFLRLEYIKLKEKQFEELKKLKSKEAMDATVLKKHFVLLTNLEKDESLKREEIKLLQTQHQMNEKDKIKRKRRIKEKG